MLDRESALEELKRHGIEAGQVYLLNVIPLIEVMWADGQIQPASGSCWWTS